jgi:hypothetical protein
VRSLFRGLSLCGLEIVVAGVKRYQESELSHDYASVTVTGQP